MSEVAEHRKGHPSPLFFHLGAAALAYQSGIAGMEQSHSTDFPWHPDLIKEAAALPRDLDPLKASQFALERLAGFVSGLRKWQVHPYRRAVNEPPVVWSSGAARLLDYGLAGNARAPVVFVIPSLINRAYILDIDKEYSLLRYLSTVGLRPLLLDWGAPGVAEQDYDLDAYIARQLIPALAMATKTNDKPPAILGYCMGGTLAAGLAAHKGIEISALATLAAPWDFSKYTGLPATIQAATMPSSKETLEALAQIFGYVPNDFIQYLFATINPLQAAVKFRKFDRLDMDSARARRFVALEDWLSDGVPMALPVAKNLLIDWNIANTPAAGTWEMLGNAVDLRKIHVPGLIIHGAKDNITPPAVAAPLSRSIRNSQALVPDTGHVGMIVGSRAQQDIWEPLAQFFRSNAP